MSLVWFIVALVGVLTLYIVATILWNRFRYARKLARYDNYDRTLSAQDQAYLEQAALDLEAAHSVKKPKWYGIFLYTAFFPMMFLSWAIVGGGLIVLLGLILAGPDPEPYELIYREGGNLEVAIMGVIFAGIFLAGGILYALSMLSTPLSNYIALNSSINGTDPQNVRAGLLAKLEHKVRSRELSTYSRFSPDSFLKQVNRAYRDGFMKWLYEMVLWMYGDSLCPCVFRLTV